MIRRQFLKLAAACVILPALRWVPMSVEEELLPRFDDVPMEYLGRLDFMNDSIEQKPLLASLLRRPGTGDYGRLVREARGREIVDSIKL